MYDDLIKKKIIVEINNLVNNAKKYDNDIDAYSEFMKETILNTYGVN